MFRRLSEPLPLSEASLLALRPALNAPVLNVGFLPVGPARAAIVAFGEEWGGIGLALGIRSNESGQVAVFRNQESIEPDVAVATALEPILAEAERMGFLFDEDMVASAGDGTGRVEAMELWGRLMGDLELPPAPRAVPAEPAASESIRLADERPATTPLPPASPTTPDSPPPTASVEPASLPPVSRPEPSSPPPVSAPEPSSPPPAVPAADPLESHTLILDERVPELDLGVEGTVVPDRTSQPQAEPLPEVSQETQGLESAEPAAPSPRKATRSNVEAVPEQAAAAPDSGSLPPQVPLQRTLSKFRHAGSAAEDENESIAGGNELGRIPLVRVRRGPAGSKKPSTLARLLASF